MNTKIIVMFFIPVTLIVAGVFNFTQSPLSREDSVEILKGENIEDLVESGRSIDKTYHDDRSIDEIDKENRIVGTLDSDDPKSVYLNLLKSHETDLSYESKWCRWSELDEEGSKKAEEEQKLWLSKVGYFEEADRVNYRAYDKNTLKSLAHQGDLLAFDVLTEVYLYQEYDSVKYRNTLMESIVHGSVNAIWFLVGHYRNNAKLAFRNDQISNAEDNVKKMLVYSNLALKRGDYSRLVGINKFLIDNSIEFSEMELLDIANSADELYGELETRRSNLGLEPFDNKLPKIKEVLNQQEVGRLLAEDSLSFWADNLFDEPTGCALQSAELARARREYRKYLR